jgi:hypothetical protein
VGVADTDISSQVQDPYSTVEEDSLTGRIWEVNNPPRFAATLPEA